MPGMTGGDDKVPQECLYVIRKLSYPRNITLLHVVRYVTKWGVTHQLEKREFYRTADGNLYHGKRLAFKIEDVEEIVADWPKIKQFMSLQKEDLLRIFPNDVGRV